MLRDALLLAARTEPPWRYLLYLCYGLVAPILLLLYAVGFLSVGVTACGIGLVVSLIGGPIWLVRLLRRMLGGAPSARRASVVRHPHREVRAAEAGG